jgi:hypothetical protein
MHFDLPTDAQSVLSVLYIDVFYHKQLISTIKHTGNYMYQELSHKKTPTFFPHTVCLMVLVSYFSHYEQVYFLARRQTTGVKSQRSGSSLVILRISRNTQIGFYSDLLNFKSVCVHCSHHCTKNGWVQKH